MTVLKEALKLVDEATESAIEGGKRDG